jgi:hypothetical protein
MLVVAVVVDMLMALEVLVVEVMVEVMPALLILVEAQVVEVMMLMEQREVQALLY